MQLTLSRVVSRFTFGVIGVVAAGRLALPVLAQGPGLIGAGFVSTGLCGGPDDWQGDGGRSDPADVCCAGPSSGWVVNTSGITTTFNNPGGYRTTGSTPSSLISNISIPAYAPNVEVTGVVQLTPGADSGTYMVYARASSNAVYGPSSATGTFLALVVQANATAGACGLRDNLHVYGLRSVDGRVDAEVQRDADAHVHL